MSLAKIWHSAREQLTPRASHHTGKNEENPFESITPNNPTQPRNPPQPNIDPRSSDLATPGPAHRSSHSHSHSGGPPAHLFIPGHAHPLSNGLVTPTASGFHPNTLATAPTTSLSKGDTPEFAFTMSPSARLKEKEQKRAMDIPDSPSSSAATSVAGSSPTGTNSSVGKTPPKTDLGGTQAATWAGIGAGAGAAAGTGGTGTGAGGSGASNLTTTARGQTHSRAPSNATSSQAGPRGRVKLMIIEAKNLSPPNPNARPYVVVTSDQSEFISREPIVEGEEETRAANGIGSGNLEAKGDGIGPGPGPGPGPGGEEGLEQIESGATTPSGPGPQTSLVAHDGGAADRSKASGTNTAFVIKPEDIADSSKEQQRKATEHDGQTGPAYNPVWKHEVIFDATVDDCEISISVYDRGENEECFMGYVTINTKLSPNLSIDNWFKLLPRTDEHVTGEIQLQVKYERIEHAKRSLTVTDFEFLRLIGRGTFGRVFQVRKRDTLRIYAMKVLSKRDIVAKKEVAHTIGERKILQKSSECPFLLGLKFSFQTEKELFLVMDYKGGGELFHHLQREGRFGEERARFYAAEITLAFEHLHKYDIVYRDLKPENILLDAEGHVVLCDFGLSKPDLPSDALTNTFCGTTEYLAPEVLLDDQGYTKTIDFWSLGVLLYELIAGWSPFYSEDTQQMYKNICFGKIRFPRGVMSDPGKQFVKGLLNRNPKHRLGAERGVVELKEHAFFASIDWDLLMKRQITPPFKPFLESEDSTHNFDKAFTDVNIWDEAPEEAAEAAFAAFNDFEADGQGEDDEFDEEDQSDAWLEEVKRAAQEEGRTGTGRAYSTVEPGMIPQLGDEPHSGGSQVRPAGALERGPSEDGGAGARGADVRPGAKAGGAGQGIKAVPKPLRTRKKSDGEPLTSSIQEHFRGFSFHGETLEEEGFASRHRGSKQDATLEEVEREFES